MTEFNSLNLKRFKRKADLQGTSDIMLTVESRKDHVMQIEKLGVKDFMVKPFKVGDLIDRVANIVKLEPKSKDCFFLQNKILKFANCI